MSYENLFVPTKSLRENSWNSNIVDPLNQEKLMEAIARLGMFKPILVRDTDTGFEIIGGEHRWRAALELGIDEVPIVNLGALNDKTAKEIGLADNSRYGVDDTYSLVEILKECDIDDLQSFLPMSEKEIQDTLNSVNIALNELELDEELPSSLMEESLTTKDFAIMRFRVDMENANKISKLIETTQKKQGFNQADALTNAGDALAYILLSANNTNAAH